MKSYEEMEKEMQVVFPSRNRVNFTSHNRLDNNRFDFIVFLLIVCNHFS